MGGGSNDWGAGFILFLDQSNGYMGYAQLINQAAHFCFIYLCMYFIFHDNKAFFKKPFVKGIGKPVHIYNKLYKL